MTEQLAIIKNPKFGVGDRGEVVLTFEAYINESTAALQVLSADDGVKFLRAYGVSDASYLAGKPVWMDTSRPGLSIFKRVWGGR